MAVHSQVVIIGNRVLPPHCRAVVKLSDAAGCGEEGGGGEGNSIPKLR